jgi:hypothetical protein
MTYKANLNPIKKNTLVISKLNPYKKVAQRTLSFKFFALISLSVKEFYSC